MKFEYRRDKEAGLYNASVEFGREHITLSTQHDKTRVMWTSNDDVQSAYEAIQHTFGEPDPNQPGFIQPLSQGGGRWSLSPELSGKRSPKTILGIIASQPEAIHSLFMMHNTTRVDWHQYMLAEDWPIEQRHSMLGVQSSRLLGQGALQVLFRDTASEQLREHSDEIFSQIETGDFWQPEQSNVSQLPDQPLSLRHAA